MRSSSEVGENRPNVPAFLTKLWRLVEDATYNELIHWSENGQSFIIKDQSRFSKEVLPMYFKHSNMASFIRQLNMYGFHKLVKIEHGGLRCESDEMEFFHDYFIKGQQTLLEFIKRKQVSKDDARLDSVKTLIGDVKNLQEQQDNVDNLMSAMKRENEALWREVAFLRQKHLKQQQIVEKLIQFLVTLVQPNVNVSLKRKLPLMINNANENNTGSKLPRLSRKTSDFHFNTSNEENQNGPVIHDVTDLIDKSNVHVGASAAADPSTIIGKGSLSLSDVDNPLIQSPATLGVESPHNISIASPLGENEMLEPLSILEPLHSSHPLSPEELLSDDAVEASTTVDLSSLNTPLIPMNLNDPPDFMKENLEKEDTSKPTSSDENLMQVALTEPSTSMKQPTNRTSQLSDHLDTIESELDWLQEQLSGNTFNIDPSTLLGVRGCWEPSTFKLFGSDESLLGNILPSESLRLPGGEITGNELIQYAPSLLDMDLPDEFGLAGTESDKPPEQVVDSSTSNQDLERIVDGLLNDKNS